jgi:hypothetical protein
MGERVHVFRGAGQAQNGVVTSLVVPGAANVRRRAENVCSKEIGGGNATGFETAGLGTHSQILFPVAFGRAGVTGIETRAEVRGPSPPVARKTPGGTPSDTEATPERGPVAGQSRSTYSKRNGPVTPAGQFCAHPTAAGRNRSGVEQRGVWIGRRISVTHRFTRGSGFRIETEERHPSGGFPGTVVGALFVSPPSLGVFLLVTSLGRHVEDVRNQVCAVQRSV